MIPEKPTDGNWLGWVNQNYQFAEDWERYLLTRQERPDPGSAKQLDDLRGLRDRELATELAKTWFYSVEHADEIQAELKASRDREREKERGRLIRVASQALEGKLGSSRDEQDGARAVAQRFINGPPESCSYDELRDWEKMHRYSRQVASGEQPKRPRLAADVRRENDQRKSLADIQDAVDAVPAGRPAARSEQVSLGGGW